MSVGTEELHLRVFFEVDIRRRRVYVRHFEFTEVGFHEGIRSACFQIGRVGHAKTHPTAHALGRPARLVSLTSNLVPIRAKELDYRHGCFFWKIK